MKKINMPELKGIIRDLVEEATFSLPGESYWDKFETGQKVIKIMGFKHFGGSNAEYKNDNMILRGDLLYKAITDIWNGDNEFLKSLVKQFVFKKGALSEKQGVHFAKALHDAGVRVDMIATKVKFRDEAIAARRAKAIEAAGGQEAYDKRNAERATERKANKSARYKSQGDPREGTFPGSNRSRSA